MYMNHLLSQWYAFTLKFALVCFIILVKQSKACISVILLPKIADWYLATGNTKVENVSNEIAVPTCRSLEYCYFSGMKLLSIAVTRISWISFLIVFCYSFNMQLWRSTVWNKCWSKVYYQTPDREFWVWDSLQCRCLTRVR